MLKLENIVLKIEDRIILDKLNLEINKGQIHAIMGPNGTGKSTLSKMIMGHDKYRANSGKIIYDGEDISKSPTDEISRKGIFLSMQHPLSIEGVSNSEFLRAALHSRLQTVVPLFDFIKDIEKGTEDLAISKDFLHRSINEGASGGERKKNEVLQLKILKPKLIILDELDSGLDVDSLKIVCQNINDYLKENKDTAVLIITHYPRILEYLKPSYVHILAGGRIVKTGDASLAKQIEETGYSSFGENNE